MGVNSKSCIGTFNAFNNNFTMVDERSAVFGSKGGVDACPALGKYMARILT